MASMSFAARAKRRNSAVVMDTAEDLLDKLETLSDQLSELETKYTWTSESAEEDAEKESTLMQFRDGLESARNVISVLKREKWRLNKREMSIEMRMGELEDYKSHLRNDMSSMNETVNMLSLRVVQTKNELCEAQEQMEQQDAEITSLREQLEEAQKKVEDLDKQNMELLAQLKAGEKSVPNGSAHSDHLEMEQLREENRKLKDKIREADRSVTAMLERQDSATEDREGKGKGKASAAPRQIIGPLSAGIGRLSLKTK